MLTLFVAVSLAQTSDWPAYHEIEAAAVKSGSPVVVFVGTPPRNLPGVKIAVQAAFPGCVAPAIVVGAPRDGWLERFDLPVGASDKQILDAAATRSSAPPHPLAVHPRRRAAVTTQPAVCPT